MIIPELQEQVWERYCTVGVRRHIFVILYVYSDMEQVTKYVQFLRDVANGYQVGTPTPVPGPILDLVSTSSLLLLRVDQV